MRHRSKIVFKSWEAGVKWLEAKDWFLNPVETLPENKQQRNFVKLGINYLIHLRRDGGNSPGWRIVRKAL